MAITLKVMTRRNKLLFAGAGTLLLLACAGALAYTMRQQNTQPPIPKDTASKADFPIYTLRKLPKGFNTVPTSYVYSENVLIFKANNSAQTLSITQQKKPEGFNFDEFYQEQVANRTKLADMPYDSSTGTLRDGQTNVLSVVTDKTWILVSTKSTLSTDSWTTIARNLHQQK